MTVRPLGNTLQDLNIFAEYLGCEANVLERQRFFEINHTYKPSTFDEDNEHRVYLLMDVNHLMSSKTWPDSCVRIISVICVRKHIPKPKFTDVRLNVELVRDTILDATSRI